MFIVFSLRQNKFAYVRTGGGRGEGWVKATAYALCTGEGGGGGVKNWQNFAYVLYGWPLIIYPANNITFLKRFQNTRRSNKRSFKYNSSVIMTVFETFLETPF